MTETQRVAVVTGAAGGIGMAMVRGLLAADMRVAGVDRDRDPLEALAASAREQAATQVLEITADQWRRFVAVHTTAPLALTNAVVPEMMREGWGRIVNVTTSLGTMLNAGSPTYGPSKAALEALSAIMAKDLDGTGVTVNVLVPGGITNTPMVSELGFERTKMIQPEVMVSPLLWLVSDAAANVTGRRFLGIDWDPALPPEQAADKAGAPVAWTSIATMPITPGRS